MKWFRQRGQNEPAPPPPRRQGLNPFQRSAVNSTLVHLEQQLLRLEQVVQGEEERVLLRRVAKFSPADQARLRELFEHIRKQIQAIAADYALPGTEENARSVLGGTATILWSELEDLRPSTLDRYGAVDPALEATLGPRIEMLIQSVLAVANLAKVEPDSLDKL